MDDSATTQPSALYVPAGQDRFGERRGLGVSVIEFKVTPQDNSGDLLILENVFHAKGGPPRHLHHEQDEAFYALEGEFLIEVGDERMRLRPGDSLIGATARPACLGACRRGAWPHPDHLRARRADGGVLPCRHTNQCDAPAESRSLPRAWHGTGRAATRARLNLTQSKRSSHG